MGALRPSSSSSRFHANHPFSLCVACMYVCVFVVGVQRKYEGAVNLLGQTKCMTHC
jgi:hypothetical protein